MSAEALIIWLVIGLVAGWLASLVVGGGGLITYLVSGLIGSVVGGFIFQALKLKLGIGSPIIEQIIVSTVGAIIVVIIARAIT